MSDPLSPASLMVPEVDAKLLDYDLVVVRYNYADDNRFLEDRPKVMAGLEAKLVKARDALLLAVRDATLKAERDRLLALTPEAVVEAAAKALYTARTKDWPWEYLADWQKKMWLDEAAEVLPLLLAPEIAKQEQQAAHLEEVTESFFAMRRKMGEEVARREAAEREVLGWSGRATTAEAEATRLREALTFYADEKNYHQRAPFEPGDTIVNDDKGDKARAALEAK